MDNFIYQQPKQTNMEILKNEDFTHINKPQTENLDYYVFKSFQICFKW